ncbi:MAG: hypothetical protein IJH12_05535 [Clostridia bacterium]|nr:hypothetical protein [Clostridia bacterium]
MKKRYLFILTFAIFAILMFLSTGEVKASTIFQGGDNQVFYVRTKIERWSNNNDLVFIKNDNWGGSEANDWYTKTVWLTSLETGDPENGASYQIQASALNNNRLILNNLEGSPFSQGDTIYLVEKYVINTTSHNLRYEVGETISNILPSADRLDFSFDYSSGIGQTIKNTSMQNYTPEDSYSLYTTAIATDTDVAADRDTNVWIYFGTATNKLQNKSKGTINLPVYAVKIDLTAQGNALKSGYISGCIGDIRIGKYLDERCESSVGSASGIVTYDYCFNDITNKAISDYTFYYYWLEDGNDFYGAVCGGDCIEFDNLTMSSLSVDNIEPNTYTRTIAGTLERNQTVPTGIFYDILPFIIAGMVAIAGIILLKKNPIKE